MYKFVSDLHRRYNFVCEILVHALIAATLSQYSTVSLYIHYRIHYCCFALCPPVCTLALFKFLC